MGMKSLRWYLNDYSICCIEQCCSSCCTFMKQGLKVRVPLNYEYPLSFANEIIQHFGGGVCTEERVYWYLKLNNLFPCKRDKSKCHIQYHDQNKTGQNKIIFIMEVEVGSVVVHVCNLSIQSERQEAGFLNHPQFHSKNYVGLHWPHQTIC